MITKLLSKNCGSLFLMLFVIGTLAAQNPIFTSDTTQAPQVELGEIVIKASKDQMLLKEMPASVSVVSLKEIETNEVKSLTDLSGFVPNLFMPNYGSKLTSPIYIRGIGNKINSPAVGVYVDNVPYFEKSSHNFNFYDIESIEVLRGPQGTLFGRNTRGGIINISTLSPMNYQGTNIKLSAGTYGKYSGVLSHYGKVNDKFAYSLSANYNQQDGYFVNKFNGNKVDSSQTVGFRNRLIYQVNNKLSLENIASFEISNEGAYPYGEFDKTTGETDSVNYDHLSSYNRVMFSNAFILKYKMKNADLISTSAYQYLNDDQDIDQDFMPLHFYVFAQEQQTNQFTEELVLRSTKTDNYNWLLGASGFIQNADKTLDVDFGLVPRVDYIKDYQNSVKGAAVFGEIKLNDVMVENLSLSLGSRISAETASLKFRHDTLFSKAHYNNLIDTAYSALSILQPSTKIALSYQLKQTTIYASVVSGYKSGGYNSTFEKPEELTFDPEYSINYEVGIKTSLLNKTLYLDAALFYIDMKDQQIYETPGSGIGQLLTNAGESVSKGAELTLKSAQIWDMQAMLSYGYTHATFTDYVKNSSTDYSGNFIPFAPKHTLAFNLSKAHYFKRNSILDVLKLNLLYRGAGETYWREDNLLKEDFYGVLDLKLSFLKDNFQLDVYAQNVMDTKYSAYYFYHAQIRKDFKQLSQPRTFGVNVSYKF